MHLSPLQTAAYVELAVCWIVWWAAFIRPRRQAAGQEKIQRASSSRVGIFFNFLGFACVWAYVRPVGFVKTPAELIASMILGPPAVILVWAATLHLGKQWSFAAALNKDHRLVKTGAYAWIRHPIYTSMFGMVLQTGLAYSWWPLLAAGAILFLIGIEIRVQAEDKLLEQYFQDEFFEYRGRVRAYIPFLR